MKILNISLVVYLGIMCVDLARSQELPNDEEIRQLLADRIDVQQKSVGMVVGIISPRGRRPGCPAARACGKRSVDRKYSQE